jgi:hypothetical protein
MLILGAVILGNTEALLVAVLGAILFSLLGWLFARWQARNGRW